MASQPARLDLLALGLGGLLVDEAAAGGDIAGAIEQARLGRLAVAPGAADLLIIGLQAPGASPCST